jgi:hypothetical protein
VFNVAANAGCIPKNGAAMVVTRPTMTGTEARRSQRRRDGSLRSDSRLPCPCLPALMRTLAPIALRNCRHIRSAPVVPPLRHDVSPVASQKWRRTQWWPAPPHGSPSFTQQTPNDPRQPTRTAPLPAHDCIGR